jgi:hypothetical protein
MGSHPFHDAVAKVLLHDWDPIGISAVAEAQDEYDSYVWPICGLLMENAPRQRIIDHLRIIETEHMGLTGGREHTERVADLLLQLPREDQP